MTTKLNSTLFKLLDAFSAYFIAVPLTDVLSTICLPVATLAMEQAIHKITTINCSVIEGFLAFTPRLILFKNAFITRAIDVGEDTLSLLDALVPVSLI
jgi:hypothetical protein